MTPLESLRRFSIMPYVPRLPKGREWVYFMLAASDPQIVKIGSSRDLRKRCYHLQQQSPITLKLLGACSGPAGTEFVLHAKFKQVRYYGEWFLATPDLLTFIRELPKGEMFPLGLPERWSGETGVPLAPAMTKSRYNTRRFTDPEIRSQHAESKIWGRGD